MFPLTRSTSRNRFWGGAPSFPLNIITATATAAYGPRRLDVNYTGPALRARRSADNAELDIPLATAPQTRTNLAPIPANNFGGQTVPGVVMTIADEGVEFGMPYIDVMWSGTATAASAINYYHTPPGAFNPEIHAPVSDGRVYTVSLSARLSAGTVPAGAPTLRAVCRSAAGAATVVPGVSAVAPTGVIRRYAVSFVPSGGSAYCQPNLQFPVALNEVVNFSVRFYAPNVEEGIGSLRPLLQRDTPEVVAAPGDLNLETLANFVGGENLFTWSEAFDNAAWSKAAGVTVTPNSAVAPDGTLTADTLSGTAIAGGTLILNRALIITVNVGDSYTPSIWVRNASPGLTFRIARSGAGVYEDASIAVPVSSEWQRLAVPRTFVNAQTGIRMDFVTTVTADQSIEIWGAQLRTGTQEGRYNATTSAAIALTALHNGFIPTWYDQGRYWHAVRRNLLTYTEEFDNAVWSKTAGLTVTANAAVAPNGTIKADRIVPPSGTGNAAVSQAFTYLASVYSPSVYAKADGYNFVQLFSTAAASTGFINFDLTTGAVTNSSLWTGTAENVGNGWWRLTVTTNTMNAVASNIGVHVLNTGLEPRYPATTTFNGTAGILLWGYQQEIGGTATEYQPILAGTPLNITQATAGNQPQIVVGGAVTTELGRVSPQVPSTGFIENNFGTINQPNTRSYVITRRDGVAVGSNAHYVGNFNSSPNTTEYGVTSGTINQYAGGTPNPQTVHPFVLGETAVFTSIYNNAVGSSLSKNGAVLTAPAGSPGTFAINGVRIGANSGSTTGPFAVSEVIVFASALSTADRQALERNQGAYYNVTVA